MSGTLLEAAPSSATASLALRFIANRDWHGICGTKLDLDCRVFLNELLQSFRNSARARLC
eukprot:7311713-Prymnesium_polylepis.1